MNLIIDATRYITVESNLWLQKVSPCSPGQPVVADVTTDMAVVDAVTLGKISAALTKAFGTSESLTLRGDPDGVARLATDLGSP